MGHSSSSFQQISKDEGNPCHPPPRLHRHRLRPEVLEVVQEDVLVVVPEVLEAKDQSAMMAPDQPAPMDPHQPVPMDPPPSLTETSQPLHVLMAASPGTTALMAQSPTPALMAAPRPSGDLGAMAGVPRGQNLLRWINSDL